MSTVETMRAMAIAAPGQIVAHEVPRPTPGPGEVRVRVEGCGVCGSNVPPWRGLPGLQYPRAPGQGGHEGWGRVEAVGPDVDVAVGDRVAFLGDLGWADAAIARADEVVVLPPILDGRPFPGEAFACAANVFLRSEISAGQTVAVVGIGFLGAAVVRLAALAGAHVIAVSRRSSALAFAEDLGAEHLVRPDQARGFEGRCARVIEAVGAQETLDLASALCETRGTLVIAGYHQDGPRTVDMQSWNWRGLDVVNAHERDPQRYVAGMREAVAHVLTGAWAPERFVTHTFPLADLAQALDHTAARPEGFVKAAVIP